MDLPDLRATRKALGFTQTEAAERIGLKLRGYQYIESGDVQPSRTHHMAMQLVTLQEAVRRGDGALATPEIRDLARALVALEPR